MRDLTITTVWPPCFGGRRLRTQNGELTMLGEAGDLGGLGKDPGNALILTDPVVEWMSE